VYRWGSSEHHRRQDLARFGKDPKRGGIAGWSGIYWIAHVLVAADAPSRPAGEELSATHM
jgi:hypothetical protein